MATLEGSTIASTYDRLLALPSGGLNGATLVALTDGNASATCALSVATTSISIGATNRLYLDGGSNTYIVESAADIMDFVVGGVHLLSLDDTNSEVVFNEDHTDLDFRIESDGEPNMFFIEGSSNRISIGDSTDSPAATLEITNNSSSGAFDVPLLQLNSNDVDQLALDINAANTTADVIDITANAVTTSKIIDISATGLTDGMLLNTASTSSVTDGGSSTLIATAMTNDGTGSQTAKGIFLDYNKQGVTASSKTANVAAMHIDMDDAATNNASGTVTMTGLDLDVNSASATGTIKNIGLDVAVAGADTNYAALFNGGNVGIGTATPSYLLELNRTADPRIRLVDGGTYQSHWLIESSAGTRMVGTITGDTLIAANLGRAIRFGELNADVQGNVNMTINATGQVGIGTTAPTTKLDIGGENAPRITFSPAASGQADNGGIWFRETSGHGMVGDGDEYGVYLKFDGDANVLRFDAIENGTTKVALAIPRANGRVGIGTAVPAEELEVEAADSTTIKIESTGGNSEAMLMLTNDAQQWLLKVDGGTTDNFIVRNGTTGSDKFSIMPSGNVGIGNIAPTSELEISKSDAASTLTLSSFSGTNAYSGVLKFKKSSHTSINTALQTADTETLGRIDWYGATNHASTDVFMKAASIVVEQDGAADATAVSGSLRFYTSDADDDGSPTQRMTIKSDGKVGIGYASTTPDKILHVGNPAVNLPATLALTRYDGGIDDTEELGEIYFGGTLDNSTYMYGAAIKVAAAEDSWHPSSSARSGADMSFWTVDNTTTTLDRRMTILDSGKVGIGTADPGNQLSVLSNVASNFTARFHNDAGGVGATNRYGIVISCGLYTPSSANDCSYIHFHDGNGSARGGIRSSSTADNPEFFNGSDKRMKKDIAPTSVKGLDSINALVLSEWNWDHPTIVNPKKDIGIVADDLEKVFPELIAKGSISGWDDIATDLKQIPSETKLTFVLMKAVQELSAKVTALENA